MLGNQIIKLFNVNSTRNNAAFQLIMGRANNIGGLHVTTLRNFPQVVALRLPTNVEDINSAETGRFSPLRERDISGPVITAHRYKNTEYPKIDITSQSVDPHVNSYDCRGAVNLSSSMQSNVPSPFSGDQSHLGMPGAQWGQGYKYLSEHLQSSHYLTLRNQYRGIHSAGFDVPVPNARRMSTQPTEFNTGQSTKQKLKKAVTEYGATVVVFHVTISLVSLGTFYLLVSSGLDVPGMLSYLNIGEGYITKTAASNAGTFVVAYAVHKVFAPARLAITLTATPLIVRHLRKIGILKAPTT